RNLAADQLAAYDEVAFKQDLTNRLVLIENDETMDHLIDMAVKRGWTDLTPPFVRSYTRFNRAVPDEQRPERRALEQLNPGKSVEQIVLDTFTGTGPELKPEQRAAAWE